MTKINIKAHVPEANSLVRLLPFWLPSGKLNRNEIILNQDK